MLDIYTTSVRKIVLISIFSGVSKIKDFVDTLGGSPPKDPLGERVRIEVLRGY